MADVSFILTLTQISIFSLNVCLALIYILLLVSIRRLRHIHNVFKLNVCLALTGCNVFFIVFFTMNQFYVADLYVEKYCLLLFYAYMVGPLQVPLAFISFSFHRLFLIIYYTRPFFSRKRWVVFCLTTQWIVGLLIPVPFLIRDRPYCLLQRWMHVYSMILIVLVPSSILLLINFLIFLLARSSTKRIQPQQFSVTAITQSTTAHQGKPVQRSKLCRRDVSLLKQMIYMFLIFVGGWGPVYIFLNCDSLTARTPILLPVTVVLAASSTCINIMNLFLSDHDIRQWFREKYRCCFPL